CRAGGNRPDGLNEPVTFFGIYRTQKNADITDRLLSVPNSADPKAMYLSTERVPDILGTDVF
ncbi:hypothetical protein ACNC9B_004759, partial [Escherichia coli]